MIKYIKPLRKYIAVFTGRRYFSPFDFRFGTLIGSIQKSDKVPNMNSELEAFFFEVTQQFINDVGSSKTLIENVEHLNFNIVKLENRITEFYVTNKNSMNYLLISKLIYHKLIIHYNNLIYPQLSGLLNDSYRTIRIQNLDILNAGPIENMRLYIGTGTLDYNDFSIEHSPFNYFAKLRNNRYELYKSLIGTLDYDFNSARKILKLNNNDKYYQSIMKNRNVLLIGPANSVDLNQILTNNIDLIVLLNHRGYTNTYSFLNENIYNIPVVSYYSGDRLKMLNDENIDEIIQDTIFTVWSERNIRLKFSKLNKYRVKGLRNHDSLIEFGRWNFTLYVLIDLLIYEPKKIHITGINLFIEEDIRKLYLNYFDANSKYIQNIKSICIHNPFEQFNLYNELYLNNKIKPDLTLKNLLDSGVHNYLNKLYRNIS